MNKKGSIAEISGLATVVICIMTFVTFGITTGVWEPDFWRSDLDGASIVGYDGSWGEDIVVTYTDGNTESVKGISNSYWGTMSIRDDGSKAISSLEYCINAMIPVSDTFNTREYHCAVSIVRNNNNFYQTTYTTTGFVEIKANEWTRVITVPLDIQSISTNWDNGLYVVSFENTGTIEGINAPGGLSLDIIVENGVISFLI